MNKRIGIIGCGTMGKAIVNGILVSQTVSAESIYCSVSSEGITTLSKSFPALESILSLKQDFPSISNLTTDNVVVAENCDIVLICVKPQLCSQVCSKFRFIEALRHKLVISICAGVTIAQLSTWLPGAIIVRAMPNTPCKLRCGMTVLSPPTVPSEFKQSAMQIFSLLGRARFLDEKHLNAVTGLSGSGPAFACVLLESLADGGVMMGLPRSIALELASCTLLGAARMVLETGKHPSIIKDEVTTPGGCTIAGLLTMEDGKVRSTIARAVQEATIVAGGLGK